MHAAFSVLAFTVLSGAGLGALALIALADIVATVGGVELPAMPALWTRTAALALMLVVIGLCSSVLHLANPRNAWRSAARFRTSWLSREAVFSIAFLAVAAAYVAARHFAAAAPLLLALAAVTLVLAPVVIYCTAMIYASLKPIRAWHTARVPLAYLMLGFASGALLVVATLRAYGEPVTGLALIAAVLLAGAALVKLEYFHFLAGSAGSVTIGRAIGVPQGVGPPGATSVMAARLLDAGHSRGTFLTREFVNPRRHIRPMRWLFWVASIALPLLWLVAGLSEWRGAAAAFTACIAGLFAERWLFFVEARHTVRLYHGDQRT